jgi:energy-coupling factor transport system permease protein
LPERDRRRPPRHAASDYACQFKAVDSPVHRLGAGVKLALCAALCAAAVPARTPWALGLVLALDAVFWVAARLTLAELWRDARYLVVQAALVVGLHALRHGVPDGARQGLRIGLQIGLFFVPGVVFLRTTQASQMMRGLARVLPYRLSFLVFTSFRFVPVFARELGEIAMAQRLRGAPLAPRDLLHPGRWREALECVMLPLLVRALRVADEVALSAEARGFGARSERTYFDALRMDGRAPWSERAAAPSPAAAPRGAVTAPPREPAT